jgi:hypothetical protein
LGSIEGASWAIWKVCCESESEAFECRYEERSAIVQLKSGQLQVRGGLSWYAKGRRDVIDGVQAGDSCQSRMAGHGASFDMLAKNCQQKPSCAKWANCWA